MATATVASTPGVTDTIHVTTTQAAPPPPTTGETLDTQYSGVLEGTIIANRTSAGVRFFVEGQTYDIAALRALGLPLPRPTAVLNLFNCDTSHAETDAGCYWDPYLLKQNGFYEVVSGADAGAAVSLILREAGAPPANQIWVQNRTGQRESIIVNNQVVEIAPAVVQQFAIDDHTGSVVINTRNCITQSGQTACEWSPTTVKPGYYYGLTKSEATGPNNTQLMTIALQGIVASTGEVVEQPPQANCALRVPTLNVRGGPGLEFPIVTKIRGTEDQPASVIVVGFDTTKQWLQVSERVAPNGWIIANPDFIICTGDLTALPVAGGAALAAETPTPVVAPTETPAVVAAPADVATEAPAAAAPVITEAPAAAAPAADTTTADATAGDGVSTEVATEAATDAAAATPAPAGIPAGLARIVVNNGFDQVMRFTLDQRYRVALDNLSGEWDLQPGQSLSLLVYPGMIAFSASTPWNGGLAGNAEFSIDKDQERALWLYFVPDPDGSGAWNLQY